MFFQAKWLNKPGYKSTNRTLGQDMTVITEWQGVYCPDPECVYGEKNKSIDKN